MSKVLDITDKLSFDSNPSLKIKDMTIEVNGDAPSMLRVMSMTSKDKPGIEDIQNAYTTMFPKKSQEKLEKLGLNFNDLVVVIQSAVRLISGMDTESGEQ